jgi:hypothetical protein
LIASVLVVAIQGRAADAQDGSQSQGAQGPALSIAEDNGRERGGHLDPPIPAGPSPARVETQPVHRVPVEATDQALVVTVKPRSVPVRRYVPARGFTTGMRLVRMRQAIFSSDRGG